MCLVWPRPKPRCRPCRPRLLHDQRGGALLEIALVLPIALMFTFGVIQLGIFLYSYTSATYASRVGVRYAEVHGASSLYPCTAANVVTIVSAYLTAIPASAVTVTPTWNPNNIVGNAVTVKVTLAWATGIPIDRLGTITVSTIAAGTILQ